MINHVVLFKINDFEQIEKEKIRNELKSLLESLKEKIDVLKYVEVGLNYQLDTKSYDMVLQTHFENEEDLNKYRVHPEHLKVLERIKETTSQRAAIDYII